MRITRKFSEMVDQKYPNWDVSIALRYLPVVDQIENLDLKDRKVLDVGSGEFGLATYLKGDYETTGTDIDFGEQRDKNFKIVKASAEDLPFKNNSYPVVVSVDMMEHLPKNIRKRSVEEMIRVGSKKVIILFPTGKLSVLVDRLISKYYKFTHKESIAYLDDEHMKYGLPGDEINKYIISAAKKYNKKIEQKNSGNTNSVVWVLLLFMGFSEFKPLTYIYHKLVLLLPILNKLHFWPTYRRMIAIDIIEK